MEPRALTIDGVAADAWFCSEEIERAAPIAAPPSLQLEPCMRDQYQCTGVGTPTTSVGAPKAASTMRLVIERV